VIQLRGAELIAEQEAHKTNARHAMWHVGDLSYHCSPVQIRARSLVYEHTVRRIVWCTNRRFGKSRTACTVSYEKAIHFPGARIPYAAQTGKQVEEFVEPHLRELASHAPLEMAPQDISGEWVFPPLCWYDAKGNPVRCIHDGGVEVARMRGDGDIAHCSKVVCRGSDDRKKADRLRGTGTIFGVIDEAGFIPIVNYVAKSVIGPQFWEARSVWGDDVRACMLITSTPPESPDHPFAEMLIEAEARGAAFRSTIHECEHLDARAVEEAIEDAGGEHTVQWRREGLAELVADPQNIVIPEWDDATIVGTLVS